MTLVLVHQSQAAYIEWFSKDPLLSPEPVFQVSGSKMTFPEQITITTLLKGEN